ncbi:hypothetical protein BKP35_18275 [Anaerobacillus arseniciselenatis]|uniref:Uncharacterized protein n=1 Tax=Anaerobacillus arseniciselenatis TaxID=85682 RepID=A0A1S2L6N0_9BACI|nr:hypothetical protein [Anaerobacillus arseniciselenatis]OIJ07633.1 hypothetical protein BKP35_18275 [Anaerobacillus arseniciselenatis]
MIEHKKFEKLQYSILQILGVDTENLVEADRIALDSLLEKTFRYGYEVACKNQFELKNKASFTKHELEIIYDWSRGFNSLDDEELKFRIEKLIK